jgi:oxygen-dependent protoporphyrinogen oxidase
VPDDKLLLRCFLGGASQEAVLDLPDDAILAQVRLELRRILGLTAEPLFTRIARWPRSMAQYTVGHQRRVKEIEARLRRSPGLHLAGNAYHGIGIPDCVRMGKQAAERIAGAPD